MASTDPTQIHPEHDVLSPDNIGDWSDEQIEAYREAKDAELDAQADENKAEVSRKERETIDFLKSTTETEGPQHYETVDIGEAVGASDSVEVDVTTKLTGELESKFDAISEEQGKDLPRIGNIKDAVIDAITLLIVDDTESDGDRYDFSSRAVWEAYYYDEGSEGLMQIFNAVADPALARYEKLGNSQTRGRRSTSERS